MADPFSLVYDAIIAELRANSKNRYNVISWAGAKNAQPDVAATSDLPEWQLRPTGGNVLLGKTSCSTEVVRNFSLILQTGDLRLNRYLFPSEWALLAAFYALQYSALDSVKWEDRSFVERVEITGVVTGVTDPSAQPRKIMGWASEWTIRVYMSFSSSDLGASP